MWFVYIVRCADKTFYTGIAKDAARRVAEHNADNRLGARYTRSRRPVALVYSEARKTRSGAASREYEIKQMPREKKKVLVAAQSKRGNRPRAKV